MNDTEKRNLLIVATLLEIGKRTLIKSTGTSVATKAGELTVEKDGERLITNALRTQLAVKGKA